MDFFSISYVFGIASLLAIVAKFFRQPLLIGYLFAGLILSYFGFFGDSHSLEYLGKIGVTLLLFLVGLEMNLKDLPTVGRAALITGIGQVLFTLIVGFMFATWLGFALLPSIFIAVALTFSSTIIIVKLLSEKKDLDSLYGRISVGFLLVQDLIAILILIFLSSLGSGGFGGMQFLILLAKAIFLLFLFLILSKKVLPFVYAKFLEPSSELVFVSSIAWALVFAAFVGGPLGFSIEIGGFLAGLALSSMPEHLSIASRAKPLRDFFLTIFFISLGAGLAMDSFWLVIKDALILSLPVLIGNPLIVMVLMGLMGYRSRTSFLASVTVAQISEFSFIVMAMAYSLGYVGQKEVSTIIMVGAITMTVSTYLILSAEKIFIKLKHFFKVFERKKLHEVVSGSLEEFDDHVILIGCDRVGSVLLPFLKKNRLKFVIIDFDPEVFKTLTANGHSVLLGDVSDPEILDLAKFEKARMVISTIPTLDENMAIIEHIKGLNRKPLFIANCLTKEDGIRLYETGVDFVVNPDFLAGEFLRSTFMRLNFDDRKIRKAGKAHFERLLKIKR